MSDVIKPAIELENIKNNSCEDEVTMPSEETMQTLPKETNDNIPNYVITW